MRKSILAMGLMLVFMSCEKESCTTCTLSEYPTNIEAANTFCGTSSEISIENTRLKNEAAKLQSENPGFTYTGGCE